MVELQASEFNHLLTPLGGAEQQRYDDLYGQIDPSDGSINQSQNSGQAERIDGNINTAKK